MASAMSPGLDKTETVLFLMSRSRKKFPRMTIAGSRSAKWFKQLSNRKFRKRAKEYIRRGWELPRRLYEVSEIWDARDWTAIVDPIKDAKWVRK